MDKIDDELKGGWMVQRTFTIREDQADAIADFKDTVNFSAVIRNCLDLKLKKLRKEKGE